MIGIENLISPHDSDKVLDFTQVDNIVRVSWQHMDGLDVVPAYFKFNEFIGFSSGGNLVPGTIKKVLIIYVIIHIILIGSGTNSKDYYITSDNSHIALPVSTDKYAIIPADFIDDSLIIYTNKPVTYQNNDISVQISSFEQTVIIDKHGEVVDDMIGRFILSQDI